MNTPLAIPCPHCGALNRVPAERVGERPQCGRCKQALFAGHPVELTTTNFDAVAGRGDLPVLIDFWAPWCGPCRTVSPLVERLGREHAGHLKIVKLNVDDAPAIAGRYGVQGIPLLVLIQDGAERDRLVGAAPLAQLQAWLTPHLTAPGGPASTSPR